MKVFMLGVRRLRICWHQGGLSRAPQLVLSDNVKYSLHEVLSCRYLHTVWCHAVLIGMNYISSIGPYQPFLHGDIYLHVSLSALGMSSSVGGQSDMQVYTLDDLDLQSLPAGTMPSRYRGLLGEREQGMARS